MKVINFKRFKELPVAARIIWALAFICAMIGIVTIFLSVAEIYEVQLCVSLAFCVASQILNTFGLRKYKDIIYR
ncbi:MAG: hypothetical protein K6B68_02200 [Eubacterium sp.]|nr:hypothetical protein [Eubacterium sp.]